MLDSILTTGKNHYSRVFLKECKYIIKEKKIHNYMNDNVEISSHSDEKTLFEKIQTEKILIIKNILITKFRKKISRKKNSDEENSCKEN